jgi:hypothetical protein
VTRRRHLAERAVIALLAGVLANAGRVLGDDLIAWACLAAAAGLVYRLGMLTERDNHKGG